MGHDDWLPVIAGRASASRAARMARRA
jgi:hypothetical protein